MIRAKLNLDIIAGTQVQADGHVPIAETGSGRMEKSRAPGAGLMKALIRGYQLGISPLLGPSCRHAPSCSEYAVEAIDRFGAWRGGWLAASRLSRCHPWGSHGFDPVPLSVPSTALPWRVGRWWRAGEGDMVVPGARAHPGSCGNHTWYVCRHDGEHGLPNG